MKMQHRAIATLAAVGMAAGSTLALAPAAQAAPKSLADILLADTNKKGNPSFDKNKDDFDILTAAVLGVLGANPHSPVAALTDGSVKLTAFLPNDRAFKKTSKVLGIQARGEDKVAKKLVKKLGIDAIEDVLLYHVVPGARITSEMAAKSDGAKLKTALGPTFKVKVKDNGNIRLKDKNTDVRNPKVIAVDINRKKGNKQIAHVIDGVLLPF